MKFEVPALPYEKNALEPHISARTLDFHYEKHHKGYMTKLEKAIGGKPEAEKSLEDLIRSAEGGVFNNAAQVWNHTFYWNSLSPNGGKPAGDLAAAIESAGGLQKINHELGEAASGHFGSGWAWLVLADGKVQVVSTHDAANPMRQNQVPLLTIDVWEHAFYLDYQNNKAGYVQAVIDNLLNWKFAADNFAAAKK